MTKLDFINNIDFRSVLSNPILDIGAQVLTQDQYQAFRACYCSLRVLDDMVDDRKAGKGILTKTQKQDINRELDAWINGLENRQPANDTQSLLIEIIEAFQIPIWPWKRFAESMIYDLDHNGFDTFIDFLRYSEGAAIAPGAIYMQLCKNKGTFASRKFDIRVAARPLAIFSYLVHIFRDFQVDQNNRMNYFADDLIQRSGASHDMLRDAAAEAGIAPQVRTLMATYYQCAEYYRRKARAMLDELAPILNPRSHLSLEIIYNQYHLIFEKVDVQKGAFTTAELLPSSEDVYSRIYSTIASFENNLLLEEMGGEIFDSPGEYVGALTLH